jgi:hypothetical protein
MLRFGSAHPTWSLEEMPSRLWKKRGWERHPFPAEAICAFLGYSSAANSSVWGREFLFLTNWLIARLGFEASHFSLLMSFVRSISCGTSYTAIAFA